MELQLRAGVNDEPAQRVVALVSSGMRMGLRARSAPMYDAAVAGGAGGGGGSWPVGACDGGTCVAGPELGLRGAVASGFVAAAGGLGGFGIVDGAGAGGGTGGRPSASRNHCAGTSGGIADSG